jgi:hypothetical protein
MPAVKKTSTAASKASTATPSVSAAVVATLLLIVPHSLGRPPTKKSYEFINNKAEEVFVHLFNSFTVLIYLAVTPVYNINISNDDDIKSVKSSIRYIFRHHSQYLLKLLI